MENLGLFLLKSIVVSGLLTAWYFAGLRGRRLHQYNRFFLLTTLFASLSIPLLHFNLFSIPRPVVSSLSAVSILGESAPEVTNNAAVQSEIVSSTIDWSLILGIGVASVSLLLLSVLLLRIIKLRRLTKQYPVTKQNRINLIVTDLPGAPFTFLQNLFWSSSIPIEDEIGKLIYRHELTHIEEGHTYDKLVCQILSCIFWFNPFYWIIQKELEVVHEFIADEHSVDNRDTETFAMMMLRTFNNGKYLVPEHHFFSSNVKRRLAMLQKSATPSFALLRRFMALPLIAVSVMVLSFNMVNKTIGSISPAKKKIILAVDPAHGGNDEGTKSGAFVEKEICLKYAKRLKELAEAYNIEVQLTRDHDEAVPLNTRVNFSNKLNADAFLSFHVENQPGINKAKGDFDIFISGSAPYVERSGNYSSAIFAAMESNGLIPGDTKGCQHDHNKVCSKCSKIAPQTASASKKDGMYVLKNANVPAMVMVLGNIKNTKTMEALIDQNNIDLLCNAILKGIVEGAEAKTSPKTGCTPMPKTTDKLVFGSISPDLNN